MRIGPSTPTRHCPYGMIRSWILDAFPTNKQRRSPTSLLNSNPTKRTLPAPRTVKSEYRQTKKSNQCAKIIERADPTISVKIRSGHPNKEPKQQKIRGTNSIGSAQTKRRSSTTQHETVSSHNSSFERVSVTPAWHEPHDPFPRIFLAEQQVYQPSITFTSPSS